MNGQDHEKQGCEGCRDGAALDFAVSMAFQPIFDIRTGHPFAYEALVRGPDGGPAADVLGRVSPENRYAFDQRCRVAAIEKAVEAGILETGARLSINFLPKAVYSPQACIQLTLKTAAETGFPTEKLLFEFTENEETRDPDHVKWIVDTYREMGFATAIDDFGAGHSGLGLLADLQTDFIKLDMALVRGIDGSMPRRMIVEALAGLCGKMGIAIIAEGVETPEELEALRTLGITRVQGFLLARPAFEALPPLEYDLGLGRRVRAAG